MVAPVEAEMREVEPVVAVVVLEALFCCKQTVWFWVLVEFKLLAAQADLE
jgi:hypothetical protein